MDARPPRPGGPILRRVSSVRQVTMVAQRRVPHRRRPRRRM